MRLSKYLANTGVCSRRQAERLISAGLIQVDGTKVDSNVPVTAQSVIQIFDKFKTRMPIPESTKIWVFYKPTGMICSHDDPFKRPSFYDYAKKILKQDHLISVGRLDFNSEGLIILTNSGELARVMELPASKIERTYRVRVYGRFDEEKLLKIRKGVIINGIQYGPFYCSVDNRQTRNTWLIIRMEQGKNREIRKVMQKFSLRVNRIIRLAYGPYKILNLKPGQFYETIVEPEIKNKLYNYTKKAFEAKQEQLKTKLQIEQINRGIESKVQQERLQ